MKQSTMLAKRIIVRDTTARPEDGGSRKKGKILYTNKYRRKSYLLQSGVKGL